MSRRTISSIHYEELQDSNGKWFARQTHIEQGTRESQKTYDTRGDLVTDLAFGRHEWTEWKP